MGQWSERPRQRFAPFSKIHLFEFGTENLADSDIFAEAKQ